MNPGVSGRYLGRVNVPFKMFFLHMLEISLGLNMFKVHGIYFAVHLDHRSPSQSIIGVIIDFDTTR